MRVSKIILCLAGLLVACEEDILLEVAPVVRVDPLQIDFGTIELGQQSDEEVLLGNVGPVGSTIELTVEDDCGGCFRAIAVPADLPGPSESPFVLRFRAVRLEAATATVTVFTEDPNASEIEIFAIGRGNDSRAPDVEVLPAAVDFGFVPAGGVAVSSFVVRSTGTNDLLIDQIRVEPSDAPYEITTAAPTPDAPGRLAPGAQASVGLRAVFPESGTSSASARIVLETNVLLEKNIPGVLGAVAVPVTATPNLPPIAVVGPSQQVDPWTRVFISGAMSYDQDDPPDAPLSYRWRLRSAPPGSTTELERAATATASFWVDVTGTYEVELTVTDALGLESVAPAVAVVEALPSNAVRVELTWDHPDSDLDLHLIQQPGAFCDCATDCHYRDCGIRPNWFPATPGANPELDVDDRGGFGPEAIIMNGDGPSRFIPPGRYAVAVHYFASYNEISSWPTDVSTATVRIFVFGLLSAEFTQALTSDGQLWNVADIDWPNGGIQEDGRLTPGLLCGGF